ncbi:MAG TPA: sugar ABC transporter permease [Candidatus Merdenecus merdavium]|nr:sugar ABC transporter permease [Candidatus Merdenecus merdavium]
MKQSNVKSVMSWYLLLAIPLIGTLVFNIFPLAQTVVTSFENVKGDFIGLMNYKILFTNAEFKRDVINTLYMAVLGVVFNVPVAFIIANMMNNLPKGKNIYKVIFLLPMIMSMVTVATLFKYLFMPNESGVVNYLLSFLGINPKLWLNSPSSARESLVFMAIWKGIGYNIILFFAGLQSVSPELYEAAEIDGANELHKWIYITIPSVKSTFIFVLITSSIASLKRFTEVYAISGETGNPGGALGTIMLFIYKNSFSTLNFKDEGLAAAASVFLFVMILSVTIINYIVTREKKDGSRKKVVSNDL